MNRPLRIVATSLFILSALVAAATPAAAQSAAAVAKLDANQILGAYYVIARLPIRHEKKCVGDEVVLYALGDKKRSIQIVTTCRTKADNTDAWNISGKLSKSGDGEIKQGWLWPFITRYWILELAPDAGWALAGSPNHKSLWILSRTTTLSPEILAQLQSTAAAQGFDTAKLIPIKQGH